MVIEKYGYHSIKDKNKTEINISKKNHQKHIRQTKLTENIKQGGKPVWLHDNEREI